MNNPSNTIIIERNNFAGINVREVEPVIAETAVAEGSAIEVKISEGMYDAMKALVEAFNTEDEEKIAIYEAIADDRFYEENCPTAGYRKYSLTEKEVA